MQQNKKVNWILENCIFDNANRYDEFESLIIKNGDHIGKNYTEPIMCLSSLSTARDCGFYDKCTYYVSNYSKYLGEEFLNDDYIILPLSKLADPSDKIARVIGELSDDIFFIKPNSGFKSFTGDCVEYSEIGSFCRKLLAQGISKNELVIISSAKDIESFEYRFWIIDGKIITSSVYSWDDLSIYGELDISEQLTRYVERIIKDISMSAYTIDICEDSTYFKVVEINNIYTSGTYNCDLKKLYNGLRNLAIKEYEDLNDI